MTEQTREHQFTAIISAYEKSILASAVETWFDATIETIDAVMKACQPMGLAERGVQQFAREHWYTRLAAALTVYVTHPDVRLTLDQLRKLSIRKQPIAYIFNASGYRNMGHLVSMMGDEKPDGRVDLHLQKAPILLAVSGLDDVSPELIDIALTQPPELLLILMLGWLNQRAVLTEKGARNRAKLLAAGPLIENVSMLDEDIGHVVNAWMYTTYADYAPKHEIKRSFNQMLLRRMGDLPDQIAIAPCSRAKPRLVVIHERFISQHAMFRCYSPLIRGLRQHFELISVAEEGTIDDGSDELFDQKITLSKNEKKIRVIAADIAALQPDLIYYPSLGMSHWTVLLAQLRIAPIQVMTHGHPATSMSPCIDYVYLNEIEGDLAAQHSERVLVGPSNLTFQPHSELPDELPPLLAPSDREVRVAVNSKVMKLSPRLIDICKDLYANADRPVRFSFFPGERNMLFDGLSAAIKTFLPSADVIPYINYSEFLNEMARCDLALAAFPFGNTNSTVDTSLLGLPTVVHCGGDSSGQTDSLVLRTAGLPEWLICRTDEEYYATALSLINSPSKRVEAMAGLDREAVRERLFSSAPAEDGNVFGQMLWHVYLRHDELQSSEQRVFHYTEWLDTCHDECN